ncbi:hypothetical protein [Candidatus Phytoplasma pruni]|uniref:Peptidase M41 domain-containing protein n=1 Tax=Candidatus Phytoplasma pruni TaxID=479893 RepID=A0A851HAK1_9MOLU|nr:hypothetical protein [Candidatus Phytoplasma pruni]NWN45927.1 hypothetical protein [Candidatus Phytoplasma pruni]
MENNKQIDLEKIMDYTYILHSLSVTLKIYKGEGVFRNDADFENHQKDQKTLQNLRKEQKHYTKKEFQLLKKKYRFWNYESDINYVIRYYDIICIEELLTPLPFNFHNIDINDYLVLKNPLEADTREMIKYTQALYIVFVELEKYQQQGLFYHEDFDLLEKYRIKLAQLTSQQGFYNKEDFEQLKDHLIKNGLKRDFFGNYIFKNIQHIVDHFDLFSIKEVIKPVHNPIMKRFTSTHHEAGHAIIALSSKYWDLWRIVVFETGGGGCDYFSTKMGELTAKQKVEKIKELMAFYYGGLVGEEWLQTQYHQIKPQASPSDLATVRKKALELLYFNEYNKFKENITAKDLNLKTFRYLSIQQKEYIAKVEKEAYQKAVEIIKDKEFLIPTIYEIYTQKKQYFLTKDELLEELKKRNIELNLPN